MAFLLRKVYATVSCNLAWRYVPMHSERGVMSDKKLYLLEKVFLFTLVLGVVVFGLISFFSGNSVWLVFSVICGIFIVPILLGFIGALIPVKVTKSWGTFCEKASYFLTSMSVILIGSCVLVAGFGVICFQLYQFLRLGEWQSISVIDSLAYFEVQWALRPTDWIGVWEILKKVPVSISLIASSFLFFSGYDNIKPRNITNCSS